MSLLPGVAAHSMMWGGPFNDVGRQLRARHGARQSLAMSLCSVRAAQNWDGLRPCYGPLFPRAPPSAFGGARFARAKEKGDHNI